MKITINTNIAENDLKLIKEIIATSKFESLDEYFVYLIKHLTDTNIINPISHANYLLLQRRNQPLINKTSQKLQLIIDPTQLSPDLLTNLQQALTYNSYWDISRLFTYAMCQILTNTANTFNFKFTANDTMLIDNVWANYYLASLRQITKEDDLNDSAK